MSSSDPQQAGWRELPAESGGTPTDAAPLAVAHAAASSAGSPAGVHAERGGRLGWAVAFGLLFAAFSVAAVFLLVPFRGNPNPGIESIASGNSRVRLLSVLAQKFVDTAPDDPVRTGTELSLLVGAGSAALLLLPIAVLRWTWRRRPGAAGGLFLLAVVFAGGLAGYRLGALIIAVGGVGAVLATWLNPRGLGTRITRFWATVKLPGVQARTSGRRPGAVVAVYLILVPEVIYGFGAVAGTRLANLPLDVQVGGDASLAKPLTEANVNIYPIKSDGQPGALLAAAVTDANGHYVATVARHPGESLLVVTSGGYYVDEISGKRLSVSPKDSLTTVLSPDATYSSLSPLTTFATTRAMALAASGVSVDESIAASFTAVEVQYDLGPMTDIYPEIADVSPGEQVDVPDLESRQLGLILAGLDQEAASLGVSEFALSDAVASDLRDGNLDGEDGSVPVLLDDGSQLSGDATTSALQNGIDSFAASPQNLTGDPPPQVAPQPMPIDAPTGSMYGCSGTLPAFVDGEAAQLTVTECGGATPYTCAIAGGTLAPGFDLSSTCVISYDGRSVVAASSMSISAPFSIRVSDAAHPPQSVTVSDLRITVIHKPPELTVYPGSCPPPDQACPPTKVADATGGVPSYTFQEGSPPVPLGMRIVTFNAGSRHPSLGDLQGDRAMLTSTVTTSATRAYQPGTYSFEVCVVDSAGFESCAPTTVTVAAPPPSPTPTATEIPTPPSETSAPAETPLATPDNLPQGFPTDLPAGDYDMSVSVASAEGNQSYDAGVTSMSDGDATALAQAVSQAVDQARSSCDCTVQYTSFNGTEFDVVVSGSGYEFRIRVTKVG